jgi:hypothetical protein
MQLVVQIDEVGLADMLQQDFTIDKEWKGDLLFQIFSEFFVCRANTARARRFMHAQRSPGSLLA